MITGFNRGTLLAPCLFFVMAAIARAQTPPSEPVCTPTAKREMDYEAATIRDFTKPEIADIQQCLKERRCYGSDPAQTDGIVGQYTEAALDLAKRGRCAPPSAGNPLFTCTLSPDDLNKLAPPSPPQHDSASKSTSDNGAPEVSNAKTEDGSNAGPTANDNKSANTPVSRKPPSPPATMKTAPEAAVKTNRADNLFPACQSNDEPPSHATTLKESLSPMAGMNYPSQELFKSQIQFLVCSAKEKEEDGNTIQYPLQDSLQNQGNTIVKGSCSAYVNPKAVSSWTEYWELPMSNVPSNEVYGFYAPGIMDPSVPAANPPQNPRPSPPKADFGILRRIGWFGDITFTSTGEVGERSGDNVAALQPAKLSMIDHNVEIARRFDVKVDLVIYRNASETDWKYMIAHSEREYLLSTLSQNIAEFVAQPVGGFLNSVQRYVLLWPLSTALTIAPTRWDGATLFLDGYPYDDPVALDFLMDLLRKVRSELDRKQTPKGIGKTPVHRLRLNVVIPFESFIQESAQCAPTEDGQPEKVPCFMQRIATLVPQTWPASAQSDPSEQVGAVVDNFIVFLPQPTSENKKELREKIEEQFEKLKSTTKSESYAFQRFQILNRIVYVLSPAIDKDEKGNITAAGVVQKNHLTDDMIYGKEDFGGVAFWPMPGYNNSDKDELNNGLANDIRELFAAKSKSQTSRQVVWIRIVNFFFGYSREIVVSVEGTLLLCAIFAVAAYWSFDLRKFWQVHLRWFAGLAVLIGAAGLMLFHSVPRLQAYTLGFIVALTFAFLFYRRVRTSVRNLYKDLP